jgi:HEAT repeat protein
VELVMTARTEAVEARQIRTAAELFDALASPDPITRLTVVKAIQKQPAAALKLGLFKGRDVIDGLLAYSTRVEGTLEWMDWLGALAGFRDPRVASFFLDLLRLYDEAVVVFAAMRYLAAEDSPPRPAALIPLLLQNECPVRARAAAELLSHSDRLSAEARVRVGLLSSEAAPVAIDSETACAWFSELHCPFRAEAMTDLEAQGLPAWTQLTNAWDKLGSDDQVWLLEWASRDYQHSIGPALEAGLSSACMRVLQAALETLSRDEIRDLHPWLLPFAGQALTNIDPRIRRAGMAANPPGVDWRAMLRGDPDPLVRRACLTALRKCEGERALPELVDALRDQSWQTRAVAAKELAALGATGIESVRPLVHDSQEYIRIAAAAVLAELEDYAWLERELLSDV